MLKISVVTPTYNRVHTLKKNIESVLSQGRKDIEHIIVDNMSSDGTDVLIRQYRKKVPYEVVYIREKDTGVYQAMNKGIKASRGGWIHILNSDDRYYDSKVLSALMNEKNSSYDVIATVIEYIKKGQKCRWIPEYDKKRNHHNFPHPGVFIRKKFYEEHGLYSEKYGMISDAIFMALNFPEARIKIMDFPAVFMSGEGLSSRITLKNLSERFQSIMYYHKFPLSYKIRLILYLLSDVINGYLIWPIKEKILSNPKTS